MMTSNCTIVTQNNLIYNFFLVTFAAKAASTAAAAATDQIMNGTCVCVWFVGKIDKYKTKKK